MMPEVLTTWMWENNIELAGALLGLLYIFFSIRQNIFTWPTGLLTSLLYIAVFYRAGFYADMGLQLYYAFISVYGWYYWIRGKSNNTEALSARVKKTSLKLFLIISAVTILIYGVLLLVLLNFTDSTVPYMDSLTTAFSITATWMLARKYLEHWLIWIFVDLLSAGLYIYKELWPTVVLFLVYTVMAVIGYYEWKKDLTERIEKNY